MRHNSPMRENFRLFFSVLWFVSTGCAFAGLLAFVLTWGGYATFFYWSVGVWVVSTIIVFITTFE